MGEPSKVKVKGPQLDCPLTERVQDVPAMSSYSTLSAFRDEQARRLYQHACRLERVMQAAMAYLGQTQAIHGDDACDERTTEKLREALAEANNGAL